MAFLVVYFLHCFYTPRVFTCIVLSRADFQSLEAQSWFITWRVRAAAALDAWYLRVGKVELLSRLALPRHWKAARVFPWHTPVPLVSHYLWRQLDGYTVQNPRELQYLLILYLEIGSRNRHNFLMKNTIDFKYLEAEKLLGDQIEELRYKKHRHRATSCEYLLSTVLPWAAVIVLSLLLVISLSSRRLPTCAFARGEVGTELG